MEEKQINKDEKSCRNQNCDLSVEPAQKLCVCGRDYPGLSQSDLTKCSACWGIIPNTVLRCGHCGESLKSKAPSYGTSVTMFVIVSFMYAEIAAWSWLHLCAFSIFSFVGIAAFVTGMVDTHKVKSREHSQKLSQAGFAISAIMLVGVLILITLLVAARWPG